MTFAFTVPGGVPTLTQSGTDTSLSGVATAIAAIPAVARVTAYSVGVLLRLPASNGFIYRCSVAGTTDAIQPAYGVTSGGTTSDGTASFVAIPAPYGQISGGKTIYRISTFRILFNGTLTINAGLEGFEFYDCPINEVVSLNSPAVLTINSLLNGQPTYEEAIVIRPASGSVQTEFMVKSGATFTMNGAKLVVSGIGGSDYQSVYFNKGSFVNITKGWIKSTKNQVRWGESGSGNMSGMNISGMVAERIYTTIFGVFGSFSGLAPLNSVTQMVSYGAFTSTSLRDYAPLDTGSFLDNYDVKSLLVVNSLGSGLDFRSGQGPGKWTTLQKEFTLKTLTAAGAGISGAVAYVKDTNNGGRVDISFIPNQLNNNVYIQSTSGAGITPVTSLYVMHAQAQSGYQSIPIRDYRTKTTVAGADLFDVSVWAYGYNYAALNDVAMKGTGVLALSTNLIADTNITLTEAQAVAKLASSFTVVGNVLTVTANSTLSDMYDAVKAYKTRPVQAQLEYPSIGAQPITASGDQLSTAMTIVVNPGVTLSGSAKFKVLAAAGVSLGGVIAGLEVIGNVTQATPTDLTNVTISGSLTYNTSASSLFTFTNVTAGTVSNSGAGIVSIKRINSNLTAGTNVVSYAPTVVSLTLNGGRIRILDNLGAEQYNQTVDASIDLPASATGVWTYVIRKYGQQPIVGGFTVNGGAVSVVAAYIPDTQVIAPEATVAAYATLDGSQQIYDYLSLYGATAAGIVFGVVASKGFGTLTVPAGLTLDPSAASIVSIAAGVVTAKTNAIPEAVTLISAGNVVQGAAVFGDDVAIRANNLDSELSYTADALTFYPSANDRNNGTNPGASIVGGLYRFKFGATVSGVTLSGASLMRATVGGITFFADITLATGRNVLDLGIQSQIAALTARTLTLPQIEATKVLALKSDVWAAAQ